MTMLEAVTSEDQKSAEQLEEEFHGRPPKTHPAWTGQAHGRGQRPSPRRCGTPQSKVRGQTRRTIVALAQLIFFATATGDAWPLDSEDGRAAPLARDPEPIHIEETDASFSIEWRGTTASGCGLRLRRL